MPYTVSPSRFAAGSLASATGLNLLRGSILALLGGYRRPHPIWAVTRLDLTNWQAGDIGSGWRRLYDGWIRHKANTLAWAVQVQRESSFRCEIRLNYGQNTATVATLANGSDALTVASGTVSVSSLAGFYPVSLDVRALAGGQPTWHVNTLWAMPAQLAELAPVSHAALHRFFAGDTPTAADWQALSDRATVLGDQLGGASAPWLGEAPGPNKSLWGSVVHTNEYLRYDIRMSTPEIYPTENPEQAQVEHATYVAVVYYNDVQVGAVGWGVLASANSNLTSIMLKNAAYFSNGQTIDLQSGHRLTLGGKSGSTFAACTVLWGGWRTPAAGDWLRHIEATDKHGDKEDGWANLTGVFDLRPLNLAEGQRYTVRVLIFYDSHGWGNNTTARTKVLLLAEQPATSPTLDGWTAMPVFSHGQTVTGAGSVRPLSTNLTWLSGRIVYANDATPRRSWGQPFFWTLRQCRWLHYYCKYEEGKDKDEPKPTLGYMRGSEWKTGSLPYRPNEWLVYDLESLDGLWPGQPYRVDLPGWCLEDEVA